MIYCQVDGTRLDEVTRPILKSSRVEVEFPELEGLILSHRDSVIYRIREVVRDAIGRITEGHYDSDLHFARILIEIQKSRDLYRGFVGKKSGQAISAFLEENFTKDDLKPIFEKMEKDFLLSKDDPEKKYHILRSYIEVKTEEVFLDLIRKLREIER
jgi:hypothetical protein